MSPLSSQSTRQTFVENFQIAFQRIIWRLLEENCLMQHHFVNHIHNNAKNPQWQLWIPEAAITREIPEKSSLDNSDKKWRARTIHSFPAIRLSNQSPSISRHVLYAWYYLGTPPGNACRLQVSNVKVFLLFLGRQLRVLLLYFFSTYSSSCTTLLDMLGDHSTTCPTSKNKFWHHFLLWSQPSKQHSNLLTCTKVPTSRIFDNNHRQRDVPIPFCKRCRPLALGLTIRPTNKTLVRHKAV